MSPPELPANAPVLDVLHPVVVNPAPTLREECQIAFLSDSDRVRHTRIFQKPLLRKAGFNWNIGAFAESNVVLVRLFLLEHTQRPELFCRDFPGLETVHPTEIGSG